MKLSLTYSAYREMEQIPAPPLRHIGEAILSLAEDPLPQGSAVFEVGGGCLCLPVEDYVILYHLETGGEGALTVLGVVQDAAPTLH